MAHARWIVTAHCASRLAGCDENINTSLFLRGGTSGAVVFHARDLLSDSALLERFFVHMPGSPDRNGRQLDALAGGVSSLSKIVLVAPSLRADANIDYTFVQVAVDRLMRGSLPVPSEWSHNQARQRRAKQRVCIGLPSVNRWQAYDGSVYTTP